MSSTNSRSWPHKADANVKETFEDGMERKRKILSEEVTERLTGRSEIWNVTKRKRSGGGRMRSANVKQDFTGDAPVITLTPYMDVEAVQEVTGIGNQSGMDSILNLSSKNQMKLLPSAHIEKFLAGNSKPIAGVRKRITKSTLSEAGVRHNTIVSRFTVTNVNKAAREFPDKGGPLYKRLLSALIDENQDFDRRSDEKTDQSRMAEWEMDFLGPVPDENLLLKELHLVGIYLEILPALVEKEDVTDHINKEPQEVMKPMLASEPPKRRRGRPRSKHLKNPIPEKNETNKEPIPKRKRGRKRKNPQMDKCQEVKEPSLEIHETKSKIVTPSVPKVIPQELKSASPFPSTDQKITEDDSSKELDMIDLNNNPPDDLTLMLDLDDLDDVLPQNVDDEDLSCLDIPMDDISTLNFNFWP